MSSNYNNAIERLNNIKWAEIGKKEEVWQILLVQEYFIRISKLQMDLTPEKFRVPYFPYSIAELLETKFNIERPDIDIYELVPKIKDNFNPITYGNYCTCYIELAILLDMNEPLAVTYRDVYEPLIKLFESGGCFYQHDGLMYSGGGGLPRKNADYYSNRREIDISDEALKKYKKNYIGKIIKEMFSKTAQIHSHSIWNIGTNKSIKILGNSIEEMQIEMEKSSDEEVIDYLYSDNIDIVIMAMFEIAERKICDDKVINALIEYSKYMDEQYELYSGWSLGKLALAVLYACDNETARQSYEKIISKIDNLSKGNIGYIARII